MLLHGVLIGESDTTDTLKGIIVLVTEEVCGGVLVEKKKGWLVDQFSISAK